MEGQNAGEILRVGRGSREGVRRQAGFIWSVPCAVVF